MAVRIPNELFSLVHERRVIPFVGAGFSMGLGLPGWAGLLRQVAQDLNVSETEPSIDFDQIYEDASEDFLRVAEYLYLRAGSNIGPLRLSISHALSVQDSLCLSAPHVELVNLGAPQVYTTNFDDAIETTYRELDQPMEVVALPRDVAVADPLQTQIVKYHGDLRYDDTLVLSESQYWRRLDLESPMDLKFRSDLLGRSVLFMGYSFSDINIRVIWFKLMRMMEDVPESDRKPSFIVRFEPNPVLEALYRDVGLTPIVLDPEGEAGTDADRTELLGEFLAELSSGASARGRIPGNANQRLFASGELITRVKTDLEKMLERTGWLPTLHPLAMLCQRDIPGTLKSNALEIVDMLAKSETVSLTQGGQLVAWASRIWGAEPPVVALTLRTLMSSFSRAEVISLELPWRIMWSAELPDDLAKPLLETVDNELRSHEARPINDDDIAYAMDLAKRFASGLALEKDTQAEARQLVDRATKIYPSVKKYRPPKDGPPNPSRMVKEIESVAAED
jgi:hypothetical protein